MTDKNNKFYYKIHLILGVFLILIISMFFIFTNTSPSLPSSSDKLTIQKSLSSDFAYQNITNTFQTFFKDSPLKESSITFKTIASQISFYTLEQQNFGTLISSKPNPQGNTITYSNIFTDTNLRYTLSSKRLLEEFIINSQPIALKFTQISQIAQTKNIDKYQQNSDGSIDFFYQNKIQFTLPKPVLYELNNQNNKNYGIKYDIQEISQNKYRIDKIITSEGLNWLANLNRNYPIVIDLVIDNADTASNWISSDSTYTPVSQDSSIKYEGTGSVKVQTTADSPQQIDLFEYSTNSIAQSNYLSSFSNNVATGGTITYISTDVVHTFKGSGTFTPVLAIGTSVLAIAGGGGGGYNSSYQTWGGGGAGGYIFNTSLNFSSGTTYPVSIGSGGTYNNNGSNTTINSLTAVGGGNGAHRQLAAGNGGSGGGGAQNTNATGGSGTSGQGNSGGNSSNSVGGGGGGGAGSAGSTPTTDVGGAGGSGLSNSISGTSVCYAGGGGAQGSSGYGTSTCGGGSKSAGTANTGGGGSGGTYSGASGIVIIRYQYLDILQCYSESTIKTEANYSLKTYAKSTYSLNQTLTKTFSSPLNLSNANTITFDLRASRTGANIKFGIHDAGGTTTEITPTVTSTNTFQTITWDISSVSNTNKDAIDSLIITITNADADNTFYMDNMNTVIQPSLNDSVTLTTSSLDLSTASNITFWINSDLAGQTLRFQFGESSSSEQNYDFTINSANTWERKIWDISAIPATSRNAVTKFAYKIINSTSAQTFNFDLVYTDNYPPFVPILDSPDNNSNLSAGPVTFQIHTTDSDSDPLQYKVKICTDSSMTTNCNTYDQTSSQVGWSGQDIGTSAYASDTNAFYTTQTDLLQETIYYWTAQAIDPSGSNTWTSAQDSPNILSTSKLPLMPNNCLLQKNNTNNSITISWSPQNIGESSYTITKKIDSASFINLVTNLSPGTTAYTDNNVTPGHVYQYQIASYFADLSHSDWCTTPRLNLQAGNFQFNGVNLDGINIY